MNFSPLFPRSAEDARLSTEKHLWGIPECPKRQNLHTVLNADVYELVSIPAQLSHLVLLSDRQWVDRERQMIMQLCEHNCIELPNAHFD